MPSGRVIQIILVTGVRFGYRFISLERSRRSKHFRAAHNAMIIGAGDAGQIVLRELLKSTKSDAKPVCLIDDDADKWGLPAGGRPRGRMAGDSILLAVEKYKVDQILFAIPHSLCPDPAGCAQHLQGDGMRAKDFAGHLSAGQRGGVPKPDEAGGCGGSSGPRAHQGEYGGNPPTSEG